MNSAMIRTLSGMVWAVVLLAASMEAQAQLDLGGLGGKALFDIKEKARDPDLLQGIDAYNKNNFVSASKVFEVFAAKGDAVAQFYLGRMHLQGQGNFKPDYGKALAFTRKAAKKELADAENQLGFLYYYGMGVPQNYKQAAGWLLKAAEQGMPEAQNGLGFLYEKGQGVQQDWVLAYKWYNLALNGGEESAAVKMKNAVASMTPKQIMEAEAQVSAWKLTHK